MSNIKDDRGYNQVWIQSESTDIRAKRRCDRFVANMQIAKDKSVMEIGCGIGKNAFWLAQDTGMKVLGTDICVPFIEKAKENYKLPNLEYSVVDFNNLVVQEENGFDYIIGNGILHHLYYQLDDSLKKIYSLLKPGGKLIFWEPNLYNPYIYLIFSYKIFREKAHLEPDEMAFTDAYISNKLKNANFQNINVEFRDFLLPGIPNFMTGLFIGLGDVAEKIPLVNRLSQSIFIVAEKAAK